MEKLLQQELLQGVSLRGREYAWKIEDVPKVVKAMTALNVSTLGGQAQFRLSDATGEMYWVNVDIQPVRNDELWEDFVKRSEKDFLMRKLRVFDILKQYKVKEVLDSVCFVLYFMEKQDHKTLMS